MDETVFLSIFGTAPILKVLDFLVVHEDFDYCLSDIAKHSGVGYSTLKQFWHTLHEQQIVKHIRTVGKAKMYKLNIENPAVKKFKEFYWEMTTRVIKKNLAHKTL